MNQPFILQFFFEHLYTTGSCCLKIVRLPNSPSATPFLGIIPIARSNMTALLWFYFPCNTICSCEGSQRLPVVGGILQPNLGWKGDHFISFWHPARFFLRLPRFSQLLPGLTTGTTIHVTVYTFFGWFELAVGASLFL